MKGNEGLVQILRRARHISFDDAALCSAIWKHLTEDKPFFANENAHLARESLGDDLQ